MSLARVVRAIRSMRRWVPAAVAACAVTAIGMAPAVVFGDSADADTVEVQPLPLGLVPPPQPAHEPLAVRLPRARSGAQTPIPVSGGGPAGLAGRVDQATRSGIPVTALRAYVSAAETLRMADPSCGLPWYLLAAIGRVESNHGRFAGRELLTNGRSSQPIIGLPLNGVGNVALIPDTDNGGLDTDQTYDRAIGPMQFIPGTWALVAVDGDRDGRKDPHDIDDAALAAGVYLCAGNSDLSTEDGRRAAVFRYNHSVDYVELVLALAAAYANQTAAPDVPGRPVDLPNVGTNLPPASVGAPPGLADGTVGHTPTVMPGGTTSVPSPVPTAPAPTSNNGSGTTGEPTTSAPASASPSATSPQQETTPPPTSTTPSPEPTTTTPSPSCTPDPSSTPTPTDSPTETPTSSPCPNPAG